MANDFLYKARFDVNLGRSISKGEGFLSKASLDEIAPLIEGVDFSQNIDLFGSAFNAAVVNAANKNDDGMDSKTAIAIYKNFIHKPTNIEHDKSKIIGHIINAGFSNFDEENELVTEEEVSESSELFNLSLGAVVYRYVNPDFAALIERSTDPNDAYYHKISASWEVGFNEFNIAVGSDNFKDAEIISSPKHIEELKKQLKAYGGKGKMKDGTRIYRVLKGFVCPLGIGFTKTPAANVKGMVSYEALQNKKDNPDNEDSKATIISQINNIHVKNKKETIMDAEKILSELKDLLVEKKFSEEAVANMTSTFADAIKQKDEEYKQSLLKEKQEKDALASERETMKANVEKLQKDLEASNDKIKSFETRLEQEESVARFNTRMDAIDSEYEIDDEDRGVIASELKTLDGSDEAFASYQQKLAILWKNKTKVAVAAQAKDLAAKIDAEAAKKLEQSNASTETPEEIAAKTALANAQTATATLPNNNGNSAATQTLKEKYAAAFSIENIEIK